MLTTILYIIIGVPIIIWLDGKQPEKLNDCSCER